MSIGFLHSWSALFLCWELENTIQIDCNGKGLVAILFCNSRMSVKCMHAAVEYLCSMSPMMQQLDILWGGSRYALPWKTSNTPHRQQNVFPSNADAINIIWFALKCTPVALKQAFSETYLQPNELFMNLPVFPKERGMEIHDKLYAGAAAMEWQYIQSCHMILYINICLELLLVPPHGVL